VTHRPTKAVRAVVISASVGAGHDAAADEIARRLRARGAEVVRHDFLALMPPRAGRLLRDSYQRMLNAAPWSYRLLYGALDRSSALGFQVAVFSSLAAKRTMAAIPPGTDLVVSTYPLASQVLGRLRRTGQLDRPVTTYLTDFSVHRLWVADGVDAHLAVHPVPAAEAAELGAAAVYVTAPVVDPRFAPAAPGARELARDRFGLPVGGRIALLVGGSWGAGDLDAAVREIDATRLATCAVVCGRNEELRERLLLAGVKHVFGWVEDMPALLHAADVLVQNAGGMTVLEAVRCELPVITYRCIPGHGMTNSQALDEAKVAPWARYPEDLHLVLATALSSAPNAHLRLFHEADPIDTLLAIGGFGAGAAGADGPGAPRGGAGGWRGSGRPGRSDRGRWRAGWSDVRGSVAGKAVAAGARRAPAAPSGSGVDGGTVGLSVGAGAAETLMSPAEAGSPAGSRRFVPSGSAAKAAAGPGAAVASARWMAGRWIPGQRGAEQPARDRQRTAKDLLKEAV
jgi:UDP-N-acetylglucosamine:LPS N-acetylglucosamine transferase